MLHQINNVRPEERKKESDMTEAQFLSRVYSTVKAGMEIRKPHKLSKILNVTDTGNIYYLIGTSNKKAVTRADLVSVYQALTAGNLTNTTIRVISGKNKPCNATTIQWILRELNLAIEGPDGVWHPSW
jgi:hypothetical protein